MYAIGGDDTHLTASSLVEPDYTTCITLRKGYSASDITAAHKVLALHDEENGEYTIIRSIRPWVVDHVVESTPEHKYLWLNMDVGVIDARVYRCVTSHGDAILLWDASTPARVASLCDVKQSGNSLNVAEWRGRAWVSATVGWGSQHPDSRELCTLVNLSAMDTMKNGIDIRIAAGEGRLYGHCADDNGSECISALDPRESDAACEIYRDGSTWSWYDFRDVPNGVAVVPLCGHTSAHLVNIFDERSCAMIGTSMLLAANEYLFCNRAHDTQLKYVRAYHNVRRQRRLKRPPVCDTPSHRLRYSAQVLSRSQCNDVRGS